MMSRQEFRQHSKSTLLRAASIVFREREALLLVERRKWLRRCAWAAGGGLVAGLVIGLAAARLL